MLILSAWGASWFRETQHDFRWLLQRAFSVQMDAASGVALAKVRYGEPFCLWALELRFCSGITLAAQLASTNLGISFKRLAPSGARFNPLNKLKDLPKQNVPAAIQALALMAVMGYVLYLLIRDNLPRLMLLPLSTVPSAVSQISASVQQLLWRAAGVLMVFGFVELIRNRASYQRQLRMSKQEIRDEMKEGEGNPQIKGQIRRLRRELCAAA